MAAQTRLVAAGFCRGFGVGVAQSYEKALKSVSADWLGPTYLYSQSRPMPAFDPPLELTPAWSRTWRLTSKFKFTPLS